MSAVGNMLVEMTEQVIKILELHDDEDGMMFDIVQEWTMDHATLHDFQSPAVVAEAFRSSQMCPQCLQVVGSPARCQCFTKDRT